MSRFPYVENLLRIFQLILLSNWFPVSFGASNKIKIHPVLLFTLYNTKNNATKNNACPVTKELIFYADKIMVMGNFKNSCIFNFAILLKS